MCYYMHFLWATKQTQTQTHKQNTKFYIAAICTFIGARETNIFDKLVSCSFLFPNSLYLHHLFPLILHESGSGSQQYKTITIYIYIYITGPRDVTLIPFKVPHKWEIYSLQLILKGATTRKHNLNLKCITVFNSSC